MIVGVKDIEDMQVALGNILDTQKLDEEAETNLRNIASGLELLKTDVKNIAIVYGVLTNLAVVMDNAIEYVNGEAL
jgi:hypothetical protein